MSDAAAQNVFLPGLVSATGLAGSGVLSGAAGLGRPASPAAATPIDKGFHERLQALLTATQAGGEPTADVTDGLLPLPAPAQAISPESIRSALASALEAPPPHTGGNNLPPSGKALPPATQLLQTLNTVDVAAPESTAPELSMPMKPAAGAALPAAAASQNPVKPGDALPLDAATRELLGEFPTHRREPVTTSVEQIGGKGAVAQSAVAAPGLQNIVDTSRRLNLQRPASPSISASKSSANLVEADALKFAEMIAARSVAPQSVAAADNQTLHFGLHARPTEAFSLPASTGVGSEAVLRDLHNMPPMRPQVGDAGQGWSAGLGQRLLMMADNGVEVARLRLSPANLGPLEIHVNIEDDRAQVWFGTQHSQTRDALESALPRLREMFAAQGLELTQADVEDQSDRQGQRDLPQPDGAAAIALNLADKVGQGLPILPGWGAEPGTLDIYV